MSKGRGLLDGADDLTTAQLLVDEMGGPKAFLHASDQVLRAQAAGDEKETRAWLRIKSALDAILFKEPPSDENVH